MSGSRITGNIRYSISSNLSSEILNIYGKNEDNANENIINVNVVGIFVDFSIILDNSIKIKRIVNSKSILISTFWVYRKIK